MLLLQRLADTTDPLGQSQEIRALRQMGVAVDLITYPRDNHGPLSEAIYGGPFRNRGMVSTRASASCSFSRKRFKAQLPALETSGGSRPT